MVASPTRRPYCRRSLSWSDTPIMSGSWENRDEELAEGQTAEFDTQLEDDLLKSEEHVSLECWEDHSPRSVESRTTTSSAFGATSQSGGNCEESPCSPLKLRKVTRRKPASEKLVVPTLKIRRPNSKVQFRCSSEIPWQQETSTPRHRPTSTTRPSHSSKTADGRNGIAKTFEGAPRKMPYAQSKVDPQEPEVQNPIESREHSSPMSVRSRIASTSAHEATPPREGSLILEVSTSRSSTRPPSTSATANEPSPTENVEESDLTATLPRITDLQPNTLGANIVGRVISKTSLRQRSREDEHVFSFVIQDNSGKINVTAWDNVARRSFEQVRVGQCYEFTMFRIKKANPTYNITGHPNEMTLTKWTKITVLPDSTLPPLKTDILTIIQLRGRDVNSIVDLIAVVFEIGPVQLINCQDGRPRKKRNLLLIDDTCKIVTLGLWPDFTDVLENCEGRAVLFQNLQVREYNSKMMLSTTTNTIITVDSDNDTVRYLNRWFEEDSANHNYEEL